MNASFPLPDLLCGKNYRISMGSSPADVSEMDFRQLLSVAIEGRNLIISFVETLDGRVFKALNDIADRSKEDIGFLKWEFMSPNNDPVLQRVFQNLTLIREDLSIGTENDLSSFGFETPLYFKNIYYAGDFGRWTPAR